MPIIQTLLLLWALSPMAGTSGGSSVTLLDEDFESANALDHWTVTSGGEGRVGIVDTGNGKWLRMDDEVDNAVFSQNSISRQVAIAGYSRLNLSFDLKRLNDEWHDSEFAFDGRTFPVDGVTTHRIRAADLHPGFNSFSIDAITGSTFHSETLEIELEDGENRIQVTAYPFGVDAPRAESYSIHYVDPERIQELKQASIWLADHTGQIVSPGQLHAHDSDLDGSDAMGHKRKQSATCRTLAGDARQRRFPPYVVQALGGSVRSWLCSGSPADPVTNTRSVPEIAL